MIIPTADFDPMFADDGVPFQHKMFEYIRREFADLLGQRSALLRTPQGLELIAESLFSREVRKAA